jgi:hypothetical protein
VKWKIKQDGKTVSIGKFEAEGGRNYHFLSQSIGARLKASPTVANVYYFWRVNGVVKSYFVQRAPGCSGTALIGKTSGPGNLFTVNIRDCRRLHVGYQYFKKPTVVAWSVAQSGKGRYGFVAAQPGSQFQYFNVQIPLKLNARSKAQVRFLWISDGVWYEYKVNRTTDC